MEPLVLIELDDKSHLTEKAQKRDAAVNSIMQEANYPLIRIPVAMHGYDNKALSKLIEQTRFAARNAANSGKSTLAESRAAAFANKESIPTFISPSYSS
jgi:very-short-patch-repair endonuclease